MAQGSGNVSAVINFGGAAITSTIANGLSPYITLPPSILSSVVTLQGGVSSANGSGYYGFYSASSPASQTVYSVPNGKTLYVLGVYFSASNVSPFQFGYGTAVGSWTEGGSTAMTGSIYYGANSTQSNTGFYATVVNPAYTYYPIPMSFPANSIPFWRPLSNAQNYNIIMICYLQ